MTATKKSRFIIASSPPGRICTRKQASRLLQGLRRNYQFLTLEERNQVKVLILDFEPSDTRHRATNMLDGR
jgi:hypothetical protein